MNSCHYCDTKPKFLVLIDGRSPVCFACLCRYYPEAVRMISDYFAEFSGVITKLEDEIDASEGLASLADAEGTMSLEAYQDKDKGCNNKRIFKIFFSLVHNLSLVYKVWFWVFFQVACYVAFCFSGDILKIWKDGVEWEATFKEVEPTYQK